jgi:hypothetical protein
MSNEQDNKQYRRPLPTSELDLNLMLTNTLWGNPELSETIKQKLNRAELVEDSEGNRFIRKEDLWGLMGFYSRDLRLANLSTINGELEKVRYMLRLANDFLYCNMVEPFLICLSEVAGILETSQSKGGFLRKRQNTFTTENLQQQEPPKKSLWGTQKKEQ